MRQSTRRSKQVSALMLKRVCMWTTLRWKRQSRRLMRLTMRCLPDWPCPSSKRLAAMWIRCNGAFKVFHHFLRRCVAITSTSRRCSRSLRRNGGV